MEQATITINEDHTVTRSDGEMPWTGGHLLGYVAPAMTYGELSAVFGEYYCEGDQYKVDCEWEIDTPAGRATIYNWKDGPAYNEGEGLPNVEDDSETRQWHIGGTNPDVIEHVQGAINKVLN